MTSSPSTLRLLFPQWQGGNNPAYHLGAQLLAWLAPDAEGPVEEVHVARPATAKLEQEDGIIGRTMLLEQLDACLAAIRSISGIAWSFSAGTVSSILCLSLI